VRYNSIEFYTSGEPSADTYGASYKVEAQPKNFPALKNAPLTYRFLPTPLVRGDRPYTTAGCLG